jgi:hypothetical protein
MMCLVFMLPSFLLCAGPVQAQPGHAKSESGQAGVDPVSLESFTDGVVESYMRKDKLPGGYTGFGHDGISQGRSGNMGVKE